MKRKGFKQYLSLLLVTGLLVSVFCTPVLAAQSYTHWENTDGKYAVHMRAVYTVEEVLDGRSLQLEDAFQGLEQIQFGRDGYIYILDAGASAVYRLDTAYDIKDKLLITDETGTEQMLSGAQGIFVDDKGDIYLSDTENGVVLVADSTGKIKKRIGVPDSPLIPANFKFRPMRAICDSQGYLYILSEGSYYGAMLFSPGEEFLGFVGANAVGKTALDMLANMWDMLTSSDEKKANQIKEIPYQFVDFCLDSKDYLYTATGATGSGVSTGQIKKLSPAGGNILIYKDGTVSSDSNSFNFGEVETSKKYGFFRAQNFLSVAVDSNGYIYALDSTYGKVYVYDKQCHLVTAFGGGTGTGNQLGTFVDATSLAVVGTDILVCDSGKNNITVFKLTDYGATYLSAQQKTLNGDYVEAESAWLEILEEDKNNRLAYSGLAKSYLVKEDYQRAMEYAKLAEDGVTYSLAYDKVRDTFVQQNFWWLFIVGVAAVILLVVALVVFSKREKALVSNFRVRTMLRSSFHPFLSFDDVKYKNAGSVLLGTVLLVLYFGACIFEDTSAGFLFSKFSVDSFNVVFVFLRKVFVLLLWAVVNWAICSLMEGKGTLKQVFVVTAYSTVPMTVEHVLYVVLSQFLSAKDEGIITALYYLSLIMFLVILCIGTMKVHEYNFFRFIGTSVVTLLSMVLLVFVLFLILILLQECAQFVINLFMEVVYR